MIGNLKSEVELKFGRKISYQKDCNILSNSIIETTKEYISPATLRRVFGFLSTNSNPSRVTLDILSHYIGYKEWEDFVQNHIAKKQDSNCSTFEYWDIAQENAQAITDNTIKYISIKSGIEFSKTVKRQFLKERLNTFINGDYTATAIIAPGGYGKSTLLAQWSLERNNKKRNSKDIILFLNATMLDQLASTDTFVETWLMRLLGLKVDSSFLNDILQNEQQVPGKLIVAIDALDEITSQGIKQEKIFKSLIELTDKVSKLRNVKLIITTRISTWKLFSSYIRNKSDWYFIGKEVFNSNEANIPPLNFEEIQNILDKTVNTSFSNRILVHEMNPDFIKVISYPYFLQLFIQVYTPETKHLLNDQLAILSEFLKKQVYYAPFADEKIDILNQIIILSNYGTKYVMKNELKEIYPIHLKLSGNYFSAYEDLNSFGIISEETQVDSFGGYSKYIRITNQQLMCMLVVQNLIRKEQGIHSKLFSWVENNLIEPELQASIIEILFKLAYKERITKPLLDFFKLDPNILEFTLSKPSIAITLRTDNYMRNILIPHYAQHPIARKFLFENNADFNHIVDSFTFGMKMYLEYSKNSSEKLFANTILAHIGFIAIDTPLALYHFNSSKNEDPKKLPANIAGLWFSNIMLHESLMGNNNASVWIDNAAIFSSEFKSDEDRIDFAESFLPSLILIDKIDSFSKFIKLTDNLTAPNHRSSINYLLTKLYRLRVENTNISNADNSTIEQLYSFLDPLKSFSGTIMGEVMRAKYYLSISNLEIAHNCLRNAIELSNIGKYKLAEISLLQDLSINLIQLGEDQKAADCEDYINSLWKISGFKRRLP
ncbi:MAG: hypothetical protein AB7S48_12060 [Bacteroidales bacterium]